jgi:hypothetical protein
MCVFEARNKYSQQSLPELDYAGTLAHLLQKTLVFT